MKYIEDEDSAQEGVEDYSFGVFQGKKIRSTNILNCHWTTQ
jgi:hypothetical protein